MQTPILDKINYPDDLKKIPEAMLPELFAEIRQFLIEKVSKSGGHLASNLGAIELTVAIHRVFDSSKDRIIFDVGHQSYVHKILTGRKDQFDQLRTLGGLSGFSNPNESDHDAFISGHASTALSVALGMARARTMLNQNYHVIAVVGDGALTGGMNWEAINDICQAKERLIIILNDNEMSIEKNVGAISEILAKLRIRPEYFKAKDITSQMLKKIPGGKSANKIINDVKTGIKSALLPGALFENYGLMYLGPADGHDVETITGLLNYAKDRPESVLIHLKTIKGKGYLFSEKKPSHFHGISRFNIESGEPIAGNTMNFSKIFGQELKRLASDDKNICAITAAMESGTGLTDFACAFPDRFFDVGIAEQHAITMASAMAKQGLMPIFAVYSTFLQRGYDQLIHDAAILNLHIVLAIDRAGIVGQDGETHNGLFDVPFLQTIPNMQILAPSNYSELKVMLHSSIYDFGGPVAIRYPRGSEGAFQENTFDEFTKVVRSGEDLTIVTYGIMINEVIKAGDLLLKKGIHAEILKINLLNPLETDKIVTSVLKTKKLIIVEDSVKEGSFGQKLLSELTLSGTTLDKCLLINVGDRFLPAGTIPDLYKYCEIDGESVYKKALEALNIDQ